MNHMQFWITLAAYYRTKLEDAAVRFYASDVAHIPVEKLMNLFEIYRRDPKNKTLPMPSWFLEQLNPSMSDPKDQAREVASRISAAIAKFGWCNSGEAEKYIGSVGWKVVERYGGWQRVCESVGVEIDSAIFLAQTRDLSESMIKNQSRENFDQPVDFLENKKLQNLHGSNDLLKAIESRK